MNSRAFFHYILSISVLFASSFAVFHGNEHISIGNSNSVIASYTETISYPTHSESEHENIEAPHSSEEKHSVESLCDVCLVLSNLTAYGLSYSYLAVSSVQSNRKLFSLVHSKRQAFQTYLSRAPPSNA
jgi:hypothetical protein